MTPSTGRLAALVGFAVLAGLAPAPANAWSDNGHKLVCEIAWRRMTTEARDLVTTLRANDSDPMESFAASCAWADRVRSSTHPSTAPYHYVNIARGADAFEPERECPAYDCVTIGIRRYAAYLVDPTRELEERAEALKFLAHFVGDVHQPLHAGYLEDRGGNSIFVDWFGDPELDDDDVNLHAVWDRRILLRAGLKHPAAVAELDAAVTAQQAAAWRRVDFEGWAWESYRLAVDVAYDVPADRLLGAEYFERTLPVARLRIQQAGVRLAYLLDAIAAGSYP